MHEYNFRIEWIQFAIFFDGGLEIDLNDGKFLNHSPEPNLEYPTLGAYHTYAIRDIKKGEELFEDYSSYESLYPEWVINILLEYECVRNFIIRKNYYIS